MTRTLNAATLAQAIASANIPIALVKLEFDSGTIGFHSHLGTLTFDSLAYTGAGDLSFIGPVDEDSDLTRNTLKIGLRGVPNDIIAIVAGEQYQGRSCTVYLGFLSPTTMQLVGDPVEMFVGTMDYPTTELGATCDVMLYVEDEFAILDQANPRRYNNADQQARYPGDRGLEFAEQAAGKDVIWGR